MGKELRQGFQVQDAACFVVQFNEMEKNREVSHFTMDISTPPPTILPSPGLPK